ncbi:hypothetical protein [Paracoccus sp. PAR01]|uniref:hypothetical protein n=1 Tax=Paracoccus sp. PAR01 TaxID=2769282 RepID=UPI001784A779|nr:hypothetical protein [Paracoccus sp. PAR01]MBD9527072.1 hypothetical protein [Paracoccus sp. PAR01]
MSSYLFAIIFGAFCGSALGGVLADRIGAGLTFFFGAFVAILAAVLEANTIVGATVPELAPPEIEDTAPKPRAKVFLGSPLPSGSRCR